MPYKDPKKQKQYMKEYFGRYYRKNRKWIITQVSVRNKKYKREKREYIINQLGGKCVECGYNKCIAALDVHDEDSSIKESHLSGKSWTFIKQYINNNRKKLKVLCCRCHRELHHEDMM